MKRILYIMVNKAGVVMTFDFPAMQNEVDGTNLDAYRPENLRGNAQAKLGMWTRRGYSLSNWHVIETEDQ